jgi:quercetin dioxygenase-like cupin family protein
MSAFVVVELPTHRDLRGDLVVLERQLPFAVQRVFWITNADGAKRGGHRHRKTRQALVALAGRVEVLMDDGKHRETVALDRPGRCLLVEPEDWHTMTFGPGAILLVLASEPYDKSDYVAEPYGPPSEHAS